MVMIAGGPAASRTSAGLDAPRQQILEVVIERNSCNLGRLADITSRLNSVKNRLIGAHPEKARGAEARPAPVGVVSALQQQAEDINEVLNILGDIANQLESL